MDDYNTSMLSEAKNEYCVRLLNILTPLIIEGLKSILKEAHDLCITNDEESKYLMTFQNFLSRVPKWNNAIIEEEMNRIITKSGCKYLEDLLACVHITQLKVLTSIRVGSIQKKIDLDIPKLQDFIHKIYIKFARKIYKNVYLFEKHIPPLQYQKSMRECETLCKECILDVIRDSIPVEAILRSYIDDSVEEEVVEEVIETIEDPSSVVVEKEKVEEKVEEKKVIKEVNIKKIDEPKEIKTEVKEVMKEVVKEVVKKEENKIKVVTEVSKKIEKPLDIKIESLLEKSKEEIEKQKPGGLTFSNTDTTYDKETMTPTKVEAPKTFKRLEQISTEANKKRKEEEAEEDDGEKIKIFRDGPSLKLNTADVHSLDRSLKLKPIPSIAIEMLT
jgi:hypothetical protein